MLRSKVRVRCSVMRHNAVTLSRPSDVLVHERAKQHQMEGPAALKDANLFETRKGQAD